MSNTYPHRVAGALLLGISILPVHWLLLLGETGQAGAETVLYADRLWIGGLGGALLFGLLSWFAMKGVGNPIRPLESGVLLRPSGRTWACVAGGMAVLVALATTWTSFQGTPILADTFTQLVHARYWAAGVWTAPTTVFDAAWLPNLGVSSEAGWVSQYPPGAVALFVPLLLVGTPWLLGPVSHGLATVFLGLTTEEIAEDGERPLLRLAVLAFAVAPFPALIAGAQMSHAPFVALAAGSAWAAVRARGGGRGWLVLAGTLLGLAGLVRPWSAVWFAAALVLTLMPVRTWKQKLPYVLLGALPGIGLFLVYNQVAFGSLWLSGYEAAQGMAHRPGFHVDPWGNAYTPIAAMGYIGAELVSLGRRLFEAPVPLLALVGLWLVRSQRLTLASRFFLAWALAITASQVFYWHHSLILGPRIMADAAPAWVGLVILAGGGLMMRGGREGRYWTAFSGLAVIGAILLMPARLATAGQEFGPEVRMSVDVPEQPAVVFVHGTWIQRLASRMAAAGLRGDEIQTLLRQESTCRIEKALGSVEAGGAEVPSILSRPADKELVPMPLGPNSWMAVEAGEVVDGPCVPQAFSDRFTAGEITSLQWRGDLPGIERDGVLFVRDMGRVRNDAIRAAYPDRSHWVLVRDRDASGSNLALVPYSAAIDRVWGAGANHLDIESSDSGGD